MPTRRGGSAFRVWVTAPGYFNEHCFAMPGEPLKVTLQASGLVRGRVVSDSGKPVENVSVLVHGLGEAEPWFGKGPTTSADGSFAISIPCRGPFRLIGWTPAPSMSSFTSELLHGPAEDVSSGRESCARRMRGRRRRADSGVLRVVAGGFP